MRPKDETKDETKRQQDKKDDKTKRGRVSSMGNKDEVFEGNKDEVFEMIFQLGHKKFGTSDNLRTVLALKFIAEEVQGRVSGRQKLGNRHKKLHARLVEAIKHGNNIVAINETGVKTPYLLLSSDDQKRVVRSFMKAIQRHVTRHYDALKTSASHEEFGTTHEEFCSICGDGFNSNDIEILGRQKKILASRFKQACFTCSASARQAVLKKWQTKQSKNCGQHGGVATCAMAIKD